MANSGRGAWPFLAAGLLVAAAAGGYLAYRAARGTAGTFTYLPATLPASRAASTADVPLATKPVIRQPTTTFIDVVRAAHPKYTTTRPLDVPVRDLAEAARILIHHPLYLGPAYRPDLWITRSDGLSTADALKRAANPKEDVQVHVLPERVRFVHWNPGDKTWTPFVVIERPNGGFDVVSPAGRERVEPTRKFEWERAMSWNDKIVVPSEAGVSVFRFVPTVKEDYRALTSSGDGVEPGHAPVQALLDFQGLLAWIPSQEGKRGSRGAARYVAEKWSELGPDQGWPEQLLHLVPLLDGSVLRVISQPGGTVKLTLATLFKADIDEPAVAALVERMSDPDADRREAAFKALSQYGPGVYGTLEKLAGTQPPEARARLRALMRNKVQPTLGGMTLLGDQLQVVTRHDDGGAVFFAEAGVAVPREDSQPMRRVPAWLSIRPGRAVEVLDDYFVRELKPDGCEVIAFGNEWIVTGDAPGPRRWVGNGFIPLLKKDELVFSQPLGIDARGRWLFRKPGSMDQTLVLDPRLPDPTPRLPVWEYTQAKDFGWDKDEWPAVRRDGGDWSLREQGWKLLDAGKNEKLITDDATRNPFDTDTTAPGAQWAAVAGRARPLLIDRDGTHYYDGVAALRLFGKTKPVVTWPLPPAAVGRGLPTLLETKDGVLFLFNQPGRVLRLRPTPGDAEPFTLDATFTKKIPSVDRPKRIWLDPAGRIVIADTRRLVILFPEGFIPPRIRDLMPLDRSGLE